MYALGLSSKTAFRLVVIFVNDLRLLQREVCLMRGEHSFYVQVLEQIRKN